MIEDMLVDIASQGYSPDDLKETVVKTLAPYFEHKDELEKCVFDSQILSAFEFFVRYHYDTPFTQGIREILDFYRSVKAQYSDKFWRLILATYSVMVEDENKMWSVRQKKVDLNENDLYEKVVALFERIGNTLEISSKHIVQELYALSVLQAKGIVDYDLIQKQDFGVVIKNLLDKSLFVDILKTQPSNMKLSDWRNIAYHHTYSINQQIILCTYGKDRTKLQLSMPELEQYTHKIIRCSNILSIARCIFVFDNTKEIPKGIIHENAEFRQNLKNEQFKIGLLSQQFYLTDIIIEKDKVEIFLRDIQQETNQQTRIIHCSQLLVNTWLNWEKEMVYIHYFDFNGHHICRVSAQGSVCKEICEGHQELNYLADKVKYEFM